MLANKKQRGTRRNSKGDGKKKKGKQIRDKSHWTSCLSFLLALALLLKQDLLDWPECLGSLGKAKVVDKVRHIEKEVSEYQKGRRGEELIGNKKRKREEN